MATKKSKKKTSKKKNTSAIHSSRSLKKRAKPAKKQKKVLAPVTTALDYVAVSQTTLTDGQCDNIASDCVRRITGSAREYNRSDQLQQYGVNADQQCRAIIDLIIGDNKIGVGRYQFKIVDTSKISGLAPGWTMGQLANTIQSSAIPA